MKMVEALQKFAMNPIEMARARYDAWVNEMTGFGTFRDKTTYGHHEWSLRLADQELSSLYHHHDMAGRMVDVVPDEMLREGFDVDVADAAKNTTIAEKLDNLQVVSKMADAIRWGRLYGGGALLLGCDDGQDPSKPLKPARAKDINYVYVIERRVLWPSSWYTDRNNPKIGQPETYVVTPMVGGGSSSIPILVHESRLLRFNGAKTGSFEKLQMAGWDMSVLQRPHEVMRMFGTGWKAVEVLLTDGNQAVLKMTGLAEMIASGNMEALRKRLTLMELYRSVMRALVIDADAKEEYTRNSITFAGIPDTLDKFMLRLAASVQIPVTILMGQSPAGMNATGDSDFRWFYDRMRSEQTRELTPPIRRLTKIWLETQAGQRLKMQLGAEGGIGQPDPVTVKYPELWRETPSAEAARRLAIAQADEIYMTNQATLPEEVALSRFRPEGYNGDSIQMEKTARQAREKLLKDDVGKITTGELGGGSAIAQVPAKIGGAGGPAGSSEPGGNGKPTPPPAT